MTYFKWDKTFSRHKDTFLKKMWMNEMNYEQNICIKYKRAREIIILIMNDYFSNSTVLGVLSPCNYVGTHVMWLYCDCDTLLSSSPSSSPLSSPLKGQNTSWYKFAEILLSITNAYTSYTHKLGVERRRIQCNNNISALCSVQLKLGRIIDSCPRFSSLGWAPIVKFI